MTNAATAVATAVAFLWLGMVLAISFLEAPLKFRTPGVSVQVGLAIGRVVFRALNCVEVALALGVLVAVAISGRPSVAVVGAAVATAAMLAVQLGVVRPALARRSERVLAGEIVPRSRAHHVYIGLEGAKVIGLSILGVVLLAS